MAEPTAADVQEELQEYLNSKNINALFIQIVERLLIEKPDNPISFIIQYLQKTYPEQATPAFAQTMPTQDTAMLSDSDEDEDPGADEVAELPMKPGGKAQHGKRRVSVSAESLDPNKAKADIRKVPKKDEESQRILNILRNNKFLTHLDERQMKTLEEAFVPVEKKAGEVIIKQGDMGDNWYVLDLGKVEVYKKVGEAPDHKVHEYGPGDSFGELALMYNAPRAATCKAATDCKLWALDRISFKTIVMQAAISKRSQYKDFLQKVEILKQLDDYEIMTLADCLQEENYNDGEIIFRQGEPGDTFYIVKEGSAKCLQKDVHGKDVEVAHLTSGMYFGEVALLTTKKRQATVMAGPGCRLLSLDRHTFKRILGPIEGILHRNMEVYNQVMATKA